METFRETKAPGKPSPLRSRLTSAEAIGKSPLQANSIASFVGVAGFCLALPIARAVTKPHARMRCLSQIPVPRCALEQALPIQDSWGGCLWGHHSHPMAVGQRTSDVLKEGSN